MLDSNSFKYKYNRLSDARLVKNIVKKLTYNWACITIFKQLWHSKTLSPSVKYAYMSLKQSYKTPVKKDLMGIILLTTYEHLKLYIILCIFHVLKTFHIYQTTHSFPDKFKFLPPNFWNVFSITVKVRQFQVFTLMRSLIFR